MGKKNKINRWGAVNKITDIEQKFSLPTFILHLTFHPFPSFICLLLSLLFTISCWFTIVLVPVLVSYIEPLFSMTILLPYPDDGGSAFLWNIGAYVSHYRITSQKTVPSLPLVWDLTMVLKLVCFWCDGTMWLHCWHSGNLYIFLWSKMISQWNLLLFIVLFSIEWYWRENGETKSFCSTLYWLFLSTKIVDCTLTIVASFWEGRH